MIAIIDYGAGNLTSVKKAFDFLQADSVVTFDPEIVTRSDKIVLPGVGHFASTAVLADSGMRAAVLEAVKRGIPFLGICVGMQWLFQSSEEAPEVQGLGLLPGLCGRFTVSVKSPHVGWNSLDSRKPSRLLTGIDSGSFVYFTHSYRAPVSESTIAECEYGGTFSAAVENANSFGVQFHPEKSGSAGLKLLANFCAL